MFEWSEAKRKTAEHRLFPGMQPGRPREELPEPLRKGLVLVVYNIRGGVGKTTTAAILGRMLHWHKSSEELHKALGRKPRVAMIDLDSGGGLSTTMGFPKSVRLDKRGLSLATVMLGQLAPWDVVERFRGHAGLHFYMATDELKTVEAAIHAGDEVVRENIRQIFIAMRELYDIVIVDLPPKEAKIQEDLLVLLGEAKVIIPVMPEQIAIEQMAETMDMIEAAKVKNPAVDLLGIVITAYDSKDVVQAEEHLYLTVGPSNEQRAEGRRNVSELILGVVPRSVFLNRILYAKTSPVLIQKMTDLYGPVVRAVLRRVFGL